MGTDAITQVTVTKKLRRDESPFIFVRSYLIGMQPVAVKTYSALGVCVPKTYKLTRLINGVLFCLLSTMLNLLNSENVAPLRG
jgi:hypothetical protein